MDGQKKLSDEFRKTRSNIREEKHGAIKIKETTLQEEDSKPEEPERTKEKDLKMLKEFDLNVKYGPCVGIPRLDRWKRAESFGLDPPTSIKEVLLNHQTDSKYKESLWSDEKGLVP